MNQTFIRIALFAGAASVAAVAAGTLSTVTPATAGAATTGLPAAGRFPNTDGGVTFAPPAKFPAVPVTCGANQKAIVVQNPDDTALNPTGAAIRVGAATVSGATGRKNGLKVPAGSTISLDVADGVVYAASESTTDAGVALGVFCVYGGP